MHPTHQLFFTPSCSLGAHPTVAEPRAHPGHARHAPLRQCHLWDAASLHTVPRWRVSPSRHLPSGALAT